MPKIDFLSFITRKNISRKELADILEVNRASISQYISGTHGVVWEKIEKLVGLGITPEELFGKELGQKMKESILEEYLEKNLEGLKIDPLEIMKKGMVEILKRV
ncbi:MAG: helix-turn-helix domain-containing protein [Fibromonadales bacterium]|nr:helix-turn-helix domain-containing protein [Fibromonadales bacterium]